MLFTGLVINAITLLISITYPIDGSMPTPNLPILTSSNIINIPTKADSFLAISDIHLNESANKITFGDDTGVELWSSTQNELANIITMHHPKFMLNLGDSPAHIDLTRASNIQTVLRALSAQTTIPLFYVFGNNDSLEADYGPFHSTKGDLFDLDPKHSWPALNVTQCPSRKACVKSVDMTHAHTLGYYSAYPLGSNKGLRLIVLNSTIFSNHYSVKNPKKTRDAQLEMDWLAAQLKDAQTKHERVYIAMHIPVGNNPFGLFHHDMWDQNIILNGQSTPLINGLSLRNAFLTLVATYKNTIRIIISGHTHKQEFRVLYTDAPKVHPTVLNVGVPSISPIFGNNPGMQVYFFNSGFNPIDAITYFTTPKAVKWDSFSFRNDYQCPVNTTMYTCVLHQLLPYLSTSSASVLRYKSNYPNRSLSFNPWPLSSWPTILHSIKTGFSESYPR